MPRQLTEIKNFIQGTIYNDDESEIGVDSNVFSLNVDPISEQGILSAINIDRFVTTIDDTESFFIDPISWSQNENTSITSASPYYNWNRIYLDDISIFDDEQNPKIKFHGTQGKMETLELSYIEPVFETLKQSGKTGALKFTPTVAFTANNDYITIVPDTPITFVDICVKSPNLVVATVAKFAASSPSICLLAAALANPSVCHSWLL